MYGVIFSKVRICWSSHTVNAIKCRTYVRFSKTKWTESGSVLRIEKQARRLHLAKNVTIWNKRAVCGEGWIWWHKALLTRPIETGRYLCALKRDQIRNAWVYNVGMCISDHTFPGCIPSHTFWENLKRKTFHRQVEARIEMLRSDLSAWLAIRVKMLLYPTFSKFFYLRGKS